MQNKKGIQWWDTRPYFTHANLDSFIVCVLPRWNLVTHTVSLKNEILLIQLIVYLFSLLGKYRLQNKSAVAHFFQSLLNPGSCFFPKFICSYFDCPRLVCCYSCQSSSYWPYLQALQTSFIPLLWTKILLHCTSIIAANTCIAQVSQLILNLMEASCPLGESIDSI